MINIYIYIYIFLVNNFKHSVTIDIYHIVCSANILIDHYYNGKVCDFGFAYQVPEVKEGRTLITAPILARSLGYFPPEMVGGQFSIKSDVYSYGVVSFESTCSDLCWIAYNIMYL